MSALLIFNLGLHDSLKVYGALRGLSSRHFYHIQPLQDYSSYCTQLFVMPHILSASTDVVWVLTFLLSTFEFGMDTNSRTTIHFLSIKAHIFRVQR